MAIIENKLKILSTIFLFLFLAYTMKFYLVDQAQSQFELDQAGTYDNPNITSQEESEGLIDNVFDIIGSIFLQVDGAPVLVNGLLAFISGLLIFMGVAVFVAWGRELIGFT